MLPQNFFKERSKRLFRIGIQWNNFNIFPEFTDYQRSIYHIIESDINEMPLPVGYYINGAIGTGKSSLLVLIADLFMSKMYDTKFIATAEYIILNRRANTAGREFIDKIESYKNIDVLLLDNFSWSVKTDFEMRVVTDLLRFRYDHKKPTILVSNRSIQALSEENSERSEYYNQIVDYLSDAKVYKSIPIVESESLRNKENNTELNRETTALNNLSFAKFTDSAPTNTGSKKVTPEFAFKCAILTLMRFEHIITQKEFDPSPKNPFDVNEAYSRLRKAGKMIFTDTQKEKIRELKKYYYPEPTEPVCGFGMKITTNNRAVK